MYYAVFSFSFLSPFFLLYALNRTLAFVNSPPVLSPDCKFKPSRWQDPSIGTIKSNKIISIPKHGAPYLAVPDEIVVRRTHFLLVNVGATVYTETAEALGQIIVGGWRTVRRCHLQPFISGSLIRCLQSRVYKKRNTLCRGRFTRLRLKRHKRQQTLETKLQPIANTSCHSNIGWDSSLRLRRKQKSWTEFKLCRCVEHNRNERQANHAPRRPTARAWHAGRYFQVLVEAFSSN